MRPEVVAFRELNTLVRNLTDQLAGYRRRALASESRAKELEDQLASVRGELVSMREARTADAVAAVADEQVGELFPAVTMPEARSPVSVGAKGVTPSADPTTSAGVDEDVARENERLRSRLGEARERTAILVERVRFLRQQMSQGAER